MDRADHVGWSRWRPAICDLMHIVDRKMCRTSVASRAAKILICACAAAAAMCTPTLAASVQGKPADSSETAAFDIPAQSLEAALDAFGAASRMRVLYESAMTAGLYSTTVKGAFTAQGALRQLLAGTRLIARYTGPKSYTLVPMSEEETNLASAPAKVASLSSPRRELLDFRHFLGGVQAGITERLCSDLRTRPGGYRLALQFWINSAGTIQSPTVLKSSGDDARDAAITEVLRNLRFSEATPVDMPQPITMIVAPRTAAGSGDCPREVP